MLLKAHVDFFSLDLQPWRYVQNGPILVLRFSNSPSRTSGCNISLPFHTQGEEIAMVPVPHYSHMEESNVWAETSMAMLGFFVNHICVILHVSLWKGWRKAGIGETLYNKFHGNWLSGSFATSSRLHSIWGILKWMNGPNTPRSKGLGKPSWHPSLPTNNECGYLAYIY